MGIINFYRYFCKMGGSSNTVNNVVKDTNRNVNTASTTDNTHTTNNVWNV